MLAVRNLNGNITAPYLGDSTNRWLPNLTNEQHHSLPCISSSAVKYFHSNSHQAFYRKYVTREFKEMVFRDEFRIGTLIHLAILEPEKFEKYVRVCDADQRTKDFKDYRKELIQTLNNRLKVKIDVVEPKQIELSQKAIFDLQNCENEEVESVLAEIKEPEIITNDLELGGVIHKAELEPEVLEPKKPKKPKKYKNTKKAVVPLEEEPEEKILMGKNGGYILENGDELFLVKSEEMAMYRAIQRNVQKHPRLSIMLDGCIIEETGVAECPRTGLFLSARGDARHDNGYFIDPKSINSLSEKSITYALDQYSYWLQHVHYLYVANLIEPNKYKYFYFLFVSKENYEVCLTHMQAEDIELAWRIYFKILDDIATCEVEHKWKPLDKGNVIPCNISSWTRQKLISTYL